MTSGHQPDHAPRILVVEDDELIRMLVVDALADSGFKVIEASCGVSGAAAPRCAARGKSGQMSSVTDEDGMAKRASETGSARTTDRTSARDRGTDVDACSKRRRWTAEQKRQIVAESMAPGMSAAMVAGRHGISTGQFYAWRQQLLLRGAFGAEADSVPNLAGIDATASTPQLKLAIPAPPEPGTPTTAAAPVPLVQPDDRIDVTLSDGVATERLVEDFAFGTLLRPIVGAYSTVPLPHPWIAVRPTDLVTPRRLARWPIRYAASATGIASTASGGRQFQGSSCSSWWLLVLPETRRSSTSVSQASGSTPFNFAVPIRVSAIAQCSAAPSEPLNKAFFRATATPFMPRSTTLVSISSRPSSRKSTRPDQCRSV
jgi:transposase-like protein